MERFTPEKAYLEAKAIQGVARGETEKNPTDKELKEADKKIDELKAIDPTMVEMLGESVILREKLGPELSAIAVEANKKVGEKLQREMEQEADKIFDDPANESADLKDIFRQARPLMRAKLVDTFFKDWEAAMRSHKDFSGKEKVLDESIPVFRELGGKVIDNLLDRFESQLESEPK